MPDSRPPRRRRGRLGYMRSMSRSTLTPSRTERGGSVGSGGRPREAMRIRSCCERPRRRPPSGSPRFRGGAWRRGGRGRGQRGRGPHPGQPSRGPAGRRGPGNSPAVGLFGNLPTAAETARFPLEDLEMRSGAWPRSTRLARRPRPQPQSPPPPSGRIPARPRSRAPRSTTRRRRRLRKFG